jgi:hypothetical protein
VLADALISEDCDAVADAQTLWKVEAVPARVPDEDSVNRPFDGDRPSVGDDELESDRVTTAERDAVDSDDCEALADTLRDSAGVLEEVPEALAHALSESVDVCVGDVDLYADMETIAVSDALLEPVMASALIDGEAEWQLENDGIIRVAVTSIEGEIVGDIVGEADGRAVFVVHLDEMAVFEFTGVSDDNSVTEASGEGDGVSDAAMESVSTADADFDVSNDRCAELECVTVALWEDVCDKVGGAEEETRLDGVDEVEGVCEELVEGDTVAVVCWEPVGVCEFVCVPADEADTESDGDSEDVAVGLAETEVHRVTNADEDGVADVVMEAVTAGVERGVRELVWRGLGERTALSDRETRGDALAPMLPDDSADSDAPAESVSAAEPDEVDERENTVAEEVAESAAVESPDCVALRDGESVGDDDTERDAHALADDEGESRDDADRDSVGDGERDGLGEGLAEEDPLAVVVRVPAGVRVDSSMDGVGLTVAVVVTDAERVARATVADAVTVPGSDWYDDLDGVESAVLETEPERRALCVSVRVALTLASALSDMLADGERDGDEEDDTVAAAVAELEREAHDADTLALAVTDGDAERLLVGAPEALCVRLLGTESVAGDVADTDGERIGDAETLGVEDTQDDGTLLTLRVRDDRDEAVDDGEPE